MGEVIIDSFASPVFLVLYLLLLVLCGWQYRKIEKIICCPYQHQRASLYKNYGCISHSGANKEAYQAVFS